MTSSIPTRRSSLANYSIAPAVIHPEELAGLSLRRFDAWPRRVDVPTLWTDAAVLVRYLGDRSDRRVRNTPGGMGWFRSRHAPDDAAPHSGRQPFSGALALDMG